MLSRYFGFREDPFGATPDPRWLYQSHTHREALASLKYSFKSNRGFTTLIASPGMGKTTLLFRFLEDIRNSARTVFLFDTQCEPRELISYILRDLEIAPADSSVGMHEQLNNVLLEEARVGRRFVTVIDEAQNLSDAALEAVRLLTNFETPRAKLMQVVLAGQPRLSENLMKPSLVQLRQRISTVCRLEPFSADEASAYINHRIKRAGYAGEQLFTEDAVKRITEASLGIPRTINNLCFNSLSLCCALKSKQVDGTMVAEVIADQQLIPEPKEPSSVIPEIIAAQKVDTEYPKHTRRQIKPWAIAAAVMLAASVIGALAFPKLAPFCSQSKTEAWSMFAKALPPTRTIEAATEVGAASISQSNSRPGPFQIIVRPNQRLRDIALEYLGSFSEERLHQIQTLNPKLTDPDHIETGQVLWLPGSYTGKRQKAETATSNPEAQTTPNSPLASGGAVNPPDARTNIQPQSYEVTVGPNQTLSDISMKYLGDFDLARLHQIRALNPKMTNPDHILPGEKIRLPGPTLLPAKTSGTPTTRLARLT